MQDINVLKASVTSGANPRDIKMELAIEIIARFHSPAAATAARDDFIARFQKGELPKDLQERQIDTAGAPLNISSILKESGLTASTSEARRMISQGAVRVDGERVEDVDLKLVPGTVAVIQVGRRKAARICLK